MKFILVLTIFYSFSIQAAGKHALEQKCVKGDAKACKDFGNVLYEKKNIIGASKFYKKSCDMKFAAGCFNEAHLEEHDLRNPDFAINKYRQACAFGDKDGCKEFERLKTRGIKPAPLTKDNEFSITKNKPICQDAICKEEILNACKNGVKRVEKLIKEEHSAFKMKLVCKRLIDPETATDEHSKLQGNFGISYSYGYRKYCETAVYGRVVSFEETNKTDPKKIDEWKTKICNDTLIPPDKKELEMRKNYAKNSSSK